MASAIFITDPSGVILWVNLAFTRLSGYATHEAVGQTPALFSSGRHDREFYATMWKTILDGEVWQGEVIDKHKSGTSYMVDEIITPLFDRRGVASYFIVVQHDVTKRKEQSERAHHLAAYDSLTGLLNRASFLSILQRSVARVEGKGGALCLLYIDLDHFKPVNDSFGHQTGDQLLVAVGRRLRAAVRKTDIVARIGGDEFAIILLKQVSREFACSVVEKLLGALEKEFRIGPHRVLIGASVGLAFQPEDGISAPDLIGHADQAMYQAKRAGGATYHCHRSGTDGPGPLATRVHGLPIQ